MVTQLGRVTAIGEELVGNADRKILWLEMLRTLNTALPLTPGLKPGEIPDVEKLPFQQRQEIHIDEIEVQYFEKLGDWFTEIVKNRVRGTVSLGPAAGVPAATAEATGDSRASPRHLRAKAGSCN